MPTYPFTSREQDAIRALGKLGFSYFHETKKAIELVRPNDAVVEINREYQSDLALVFEFGSTVSLTGISGISIGERASSNFRGLSRGTTKTGKESHIGLQVVFHDPTKISIVVDRLLS